MELVHFPAVWVTWDAPDTACATLVLCPSALVRVPLLCNHGCSDNRGMVGPKGSRQIYRGIQILQYKTNPTRDLHSCYNTK